mgnify:FL=1
MTYQHTTTTFSRMSRKSSSRAAGLAIVGLIGTFLPPIAGTTSALAASTLSKIRFEKCSGGHRVTCVVDGDTLWIDGTKIRVADINAPEISERKCASELALGNRARDRLIELLNRGPFELKAWPGRDQDRYGRKLRVLVRNGRSLGDMLVSAGLARTWTGRRESWCGR